MKFVVLFGLQIPKKKYTAYEVSTYVFVFFKTCIFWYLPKREIVLVKKIENNIYFESSALVCFCGIYVVAWSCNQMRPTVKCYVKLQCSTCTVSALSFLNAPIKTLLLLLLLLLRCEYFSCHCDNNSRTLTFFFKILNSSVFSFQNSHVFSVDFSCDVHCNTCLLTMS